MRESVYFVGAGFTKALQRSEPVPLMMDFVHVMTHYARTDNVVLMALIGLEALECYTSKHPLLHAFANDTKPKRHRAKLLWHIRRRAPESIEDLLRAAEVVDASTPPMTPAGLDPVARAQYAINWMFGAIGWNLRLASPAASSHGDAPLSTPATHS